MTCSSRTSPSAGSQEDMPLYDILNEFQKGHSHMAVVIRHNMPAEQPTSQNANDDSAKDVRLNIDGEGHHQEKKKNKISLRKWKNSHSRMQNGNSRSRRWVRDMSLDVLQIDDNPIPKLAQEEEAVGIITMEDVIEELLQEEIFDETDYHEDL